MKTKILWTILSCLMVVALVLTSCKAPAEEKEKETIKGEVTEKEAPVVGEEEEEEVAEGPEMVIDPATGELVKKPQYGGRITISRDREIDPPDLYDGIRGRTAVELVLEKLGIGDWALDRDIFDYRTEWNPDMIYIPHLAESWEQPDPLTFIFHIRKGVHWQNRPPMNGREFNAYDVEHSWHRFLGFGKFAEAGPTQFHSSTTDLPIESVTATDKWTVVFKLSEQDFSAWGMIVGTSHGCAWIYPPEVIDTYGDVRDWKNLVGTGPYMLTDFLGPISLTFTKNPDYWAYDPKFPENRLPYADEIKILVIPDKATAMAALRTAKIDILGGPAGVDLIQAESLKRTHPELVRIGRQYLGFSYAYNHTEPPFDDIRVRKAMQAAIDREYIVETYYKGTADPTPMSVTGEGCVGFVTPFEEWPEELQREYDYDPEKAKQLLADAGYPNGFETTLTYNEAFRVYTDTDLNQICKSYWADIGVDVNLNPTEWGSYFAHLLNSDFDGILVGIHRGLDFAPLGILRYNAYTDGTYNAYGFSDPTMDAMIDAVTTATTMEEHMRLIREAQLYFAAQHPGTWIARPSSFSLHWPWLGSYNGEIAIGGGLNHTPFAFCWVDQELKEQLGH